MNWTGLRFLGKGTDPLKHKSRQMYRYLENDDLSEATVSAKPDQALIEIGVVTQRATASAVAAQNAKETDGVLAELLRSIEWKQPTENDELFSAPQFALREAGRSGGNRRVHCAQIFAEVTLDDLAK